MNIYKDVFDKRGSSYNLAMEYAPNARKEEFNTLFRHFPLTDNEKILDIPSGGEYLRNYIPESIEVNSLEFSYGFSHESKVVSLSGPWTLEKHDRVVSLAALHHIDNLTDFLSQATNCLREKGLIHIADVGKDSSISFFLDEFVGSYLEGGHTGVYRDWFNLKDSVPVNLEIVSVENRNCPWVFEDEREMIRFCKGLFGIQIAEDSVVSKALREYVGWYRSGSKVILNWRLSYVDGMRTGS